MLNSTKLRGSYSTCMRVQVFLIWFGYAKVLNANYYRHGSFHLQHHPYACGQGPVYYYRTYN